jgi:hypothetical protein
MNVISFVEICADLKGNERDLGEYNFRKGKKMTKKWQK